jgi:hypothetical protein
MKAKDKVLKLKPNATHTAYLSGRHEIRVDGILYSSTLHRESWAWAEAYRKLTKSSTHHLTT